MSGTPQVTYPKKIKSYEMQDELGHGAFSTVCKALNKTNNKIYACKIFPKSNLADKGDTDRFQREINAMAFLRHENLVALYDFFWDELNFYMIIDFCPGGELFDYIVNHDKLDEPTAALIFQQIASALQYCHSLGVAHRDLKPENVLIDQFPLIKVSDFGLCGYISDKKMMKTFCGSPCYCSPECLCRVQYDGRLSDVWSLGVILYAMVTGEHPWNITNTSIMLRQILKGAYTVPPFVSPQCKELITKMMQVNPRDRITIDQILKHPWLKVAARCPHKKPVTKPNKDIATLPPLGGLTLEEISEASAQSSQRSDNGVFSPFEDSGDDDNGSSLPKLCIRSSSLQNVRMGKLSSEKGKSGEHVNRLKPSGGQLTASNRQRSAANLLMQRGAKPKHNTGIPMMTITEDD